MYKNYFYLLRSINDLSHLLIGSTISDIYSQEKNVLFINISNNDFPNRHLTISANPQSPFILIKENHHKAKKNVAQFFNSVINSKIISIKISAPDRIIKIGLSNSTLYFTIRGNKTNIFLVDKNGFLDSFKKTKEENLEEVISHNYFTGIDHPILSNDLNNYTDLKELKNNYPMISNEIKNEIEFRISLNMCDNLIDCFKEIVNEILVNPIKIGFNSDLQKIIFIPNSFKSLLVEKDAKEFENFNNALQYYIASYYKTASKNDYKKELEKYFDKELSLLANKLNKLKSRIESGSKEELYYKYGNILLTNIYKIEKGENLINLKSFDETEDYKIKLDPKLKPEENIDRYFEKAKDEKINYKKSLELFNFTKEKYEILQKEFVNFNNVKTIDELIEVYKKIIPKKENIIKVDETQKFKYWQYKIDDKYDVYIGRDSKSNDYLSIKFANQNDYWFHTRGLPGSHVVLRVENTKEGIPKDIIKKAASLAAFYSKAKTASAAPVSYTFAKFVHKKKGMEPGKVLLQKENTLLVKPGIPKNCVLVNE
ncbi:MAG: DUF814 domain-containing protein [Ignavibacteriae bacterium]|nr:DUF814 domain-containing protein [Ignavibacteriota bacterium]